MFLLFHFLDSNSIINTAFIADIIKKTCHLHRLVFTLYLLRSLREVGPYILLNKRYNNKCKRLLFNFLHHHLGFDDFTAFVSFWQSSVSKNSIWCQNKDKSSLNGRSWLPHFLLLYGTFISTSLGNVHLI